MSKKIFYGQNDLRYLYFKYKDTKFFLMSIFAIVIFVCTILIITVIIPQIKNYLVIRQQIVAKKEMINNINKNIELIQSIDKLELNNQLELLTTALPTNKEFVSILNSLSDASIRAGVTLSDFNFNVGKVASDSGVPTQIDESSIEPTVSTEDIPVDDMGSDSNNGLDVTIAINGNFRNISLFLEQIAKSLPLSEVTSVNAEKNVATISIKFYYKAFPKLKYEEQELLQPLSEKELQIISLISSWNRNSVFEDPFEGSNNSSVPLFE